MAKTNKEKLDDLYSKRLAMAQALGFKSTSDMLTRMSRAYHGGVPVTVGIGITVTAVAVDPIRDASASEAGAE